MFNLRHITWTLNIFLNILCVIQRICCNKSDIMFKVSQEIYLNSSDSANLSSIYGTYKKSQDDGGIKTFQINLK